MANPYITNPNNNDISRSSRLLQASAIHAAEREIQNQIFKNLFNSQRVRSETCPNTQIESILRHIRSLDQLNQVMGRLDLKLLSNLAMAKLSKLSPVKFTDFISSIDNTAMVASCLLPETAAFIKNFNTPSAKLSFSLPTIPLTFDFFSIFRKIIIGLLLGIIKEIIIQFIMNSLSLLDCDRINKCAVPCNPIDNPFKNVFAKVNLKADVNTDIFLQKKINDLKLNDTVTGNATITTSNLKDNINKTLASLPLDTLDCLLNGFLSTDIVSSFLDLFDTTPDPDIWTPDNIMNIFQDLTPILNIDLTPGTIPTTPCGVITLESVMHIRLIQEGKTEAEAQAIIAALIEKTQTELTNISNFLNEVPNNINLGNLSNSDIAVAVINKSIDNVFDSIDSVRRISAHALYNILVKPTGELCIAFYAQEAPKSNDFVKDAPITVKAYLTAQTTKITEDMLNNPMFALTPEIFNNFYIKYNLESREDTLTGRIKQTQLSFEYDTVANTINVKNSNNGKVFTITTNFLIDNQAAPEILIPTFHPDELKTYLESTRRDSVFELLTSQNSHHLRDYCNIDLQPIITNIYNNLTDYIESDIGKSFYFQEFNSIEHSVENKATFSNIDYFDIETAKTRTKANING